MANVLENIDVLVTDAQWMRSAHAWRVLCELPVGGVLAPAIATLIDMKVDVRLQGSVPVEICPAHVVNVKHSKGRFTVIFETCFEKQNEIGPRLLGMIGNRSALTVTRAGEPKVEPLSKDFVKGLHVMFGNPKFQQYLQDLSGRVGVQIEIRDAATAKLVFKELAGVESCKELTDEQYQARIKNFNEWLGGKV